GPDQVGADSIDSDFTNTMNIPVEAFEMDAPIRVKRCELREGFGGPGLYRGVLGVVREFDILEWPVRFSDRGDRHFCAAQGFGGGGDGAKSISEILRADGSRILIASKEEFELGAGDRVLVRTPGGGGYGVPSNRSKVDRVADLLSGKAKATSTAI